LDITFFSSSRNVVVEDKHPAKDIPHSKALCHLSPNFSSEANCYRAAEDYLCSLLE